MRERVNRIEGKNIEVGKREPVPELLPEERPEEYLSRVTHLMMGGSFSLRHYGSGMNIQQENENQETITAAVQALIRSDSPKVKFSDEKNERVLQNIELSIKQAIVTVDSSNPLPYANTIQRRNFFGRANPLGERTPISHTLFCIGLENADTKRYLQRELNGKTVYMFGGGDSANDLIADDSFKPKLIVNIDPYIGSEAISKSGRSYLSLNHRIEDTADIIDEMKEKELPLADEIWATYSVPYYLESPEQIEGMFISITSLLAEGGTARIAPLLLQYKIQGGFENAKSVLLREIQKLMDSPEFNVYLVNNEVSTLFIERLPILKSEGSSNSNPLTHTRKAAGGVNETVGTGAIISS